MQQYFELVDGQGLKLPWPSAEGRQRDSLNFFERSVEVWKDWIRLKKEFATLGEETCGSRCDVYLYFWKVLTKTIQRW